MLTSSSADRCDGSKGSWGPGYWAWTFSRTPALIVSLYLQEGKSKLLYFLVYFELLGLTRVSKRLTVVRISHARETWEVIFNKDKKKELCNGCHAIKVNVILVSGVILWEGLFSWDYLRLRHISKKISLTLTASIDCWNSIWLYLIYWLDWVTDYESSSWKEMEKVPHRAVTSTSCPHTVF